MLGVPPSTEASTNPQDSGHSPKGKHRARVWLLSLLALFMIVGAAVFGAPGVLVDLAVVVVGLVLFGASLVHANGGLIRAGVLVSVLAAILASGVLKAVWLANNLPSPNDRSSPLPFELVAAVAPLAVVITSLSVRRSPLPLTNKVIRVSTLGLLIGFLPWLFLMITGIAD